MLQYCIVHTRIINYLYHFAVNYRYQLNAFIYIYLVSKGLEEKQQFFQTVP